MNKEKFPLIQWLMSFIPPLILLLIGLSASGILNNFINNISNNYMEIINKGVTIFSIIILGYSILRILIILIFNVYIHRLWMPKNIIKRILFLFLIGIIVMFTCTFKILMLWLVVTIITMLMHSYTDTHVNKRKEE